MSLDSTANLLFTISADPSDAQGNIQRFRGILSKELAGMQAEFSGWAKNVFGDLSTAGGMFSAMAASIAAAGVAIGGALVGAAEKAATYALAIEEGSDRTGIAAEDMSRLRYAAEMTRTNYDSLVNGLTRFASTIDAARDGTSKQADLFHRLGITQKEVEAGSADMLTLLYTVSDAFRDNMTAVERTAVARELFSRGGAELVEMLSRGSGALKEFGAQAQRLGLVIGEDSVRAAKAYRAEVAYLKAGLEGLTVTIGSRVLPILTNMFIGAEATWGGLKGMLSGGDFGAAFMASGLEAVKRLDAAAKAALASRIGLEPPGGDKQIKQTMQDFDQLSGILERVREGMTALGGEEGQIAAEAQRMTAETIKAVAQFDKLIAEGKLTGATMLEEARALAALPAAIAALTAGQTQALETKRTESAARAAEDLEARLVGFQEQTWANRERAFAIQIEQLRLKLAKEKNLTEENQRLLAAVERAGLDQIENERKEAWTKTLETMQQEMAQVLAGRMTSLERLRWIYDEDLVKYSAVEEAKALMAAKGEAAQETVRQQFALNRKVSLEAYLMDLQALKNSTGWSGVFGDLFAQSIRGNEALLREWSTSANQSLMMVRVAGEAMQESLQRSFGSFSQAMGQNIAQAIVYRTSIGEAMKAAAASALESIAAESIVQAIYSTAIGFLRIAQWDYAGASAAFQAAALFGSVGVAAAVAGRAIAPQQAGARGAGMASEGSSGSGAAAGASGGSNAQQGPRISIYVSGSIIGMSGVDELTDMINEAVMGRDVRLVATQVRQATRAVR